MKRAGIGLVVAMTALLGCGGGEEAAPVAAQPPVAEAAPQETAPQAIASGDRIDQLLKAWSDAGLNAELRSEHRSATINSMYGTVRHYEVFLNDHLVIVLEFDPENLNSTGTRFLENVEQNGTVRRTGEKAWRSGEFVLTSEATRLENGTAVEKYDLGDHPERETIIATFAAFE